jgi:hypothetical protein
MRIDGFEITVIDDTGKILEEEIIDGKSYLASEPGRGYHVNIGVYRNPNTKKFPAQFLRFGLFIDGVDVQYWKRLDLSNDAELPKELHIPVCSKFWGFKQKVNELKSFMFSKAVTNGAVDATKLALPPTDRRGTIRVVIYEARIVGGTFHNQNNPRNLTVGGTSSSNKPLEQASVVTSVGDAVSSEKEKFLPLERWENCSGTPMKTIDIYYHDRNTLNLLKQTARFKRPETVAPISSNINSSVDEQASAKRPRSQEDTAAEDEEEVFEGVAIIRRKVEVPMLDLTDDDAGPVWTTTAR